MSSIAPMPPVYPMPHVAPLHPAGAPMPHMAPPIHPMAPDMNHLMNHIYPIIRNRSVIDNRHRIRNPISLNPMDMSIWVNTILKERIATLYDSYPGLEGHAQQIQEQVKRLEKLEGCSGEVAHRATIISTFIRDCILNAKESAIQKGFQFDENVIINITFDLIHDIVQVAP